MTSRLACTGGAMFVVTAEGVRRRVPAGACRIGSHSAPRRFGAVSWRENGVDQGAEVSAEDLSAYLQGCIVQFA
jgi:hypothetical protein